MEPEEEDAIPVEVTNVHKNEDGAIVVEGRIPARFEKMIRQSEVSGWSIEEKDYPQ